MAREIFISYKYKDTLVPDLAKKSLSFQGSKLLLLPRKTRVRDYVDQLQEALKVGGHINLGEKDGESLNEFKDSTIETALKKKIFGTSVTIVMISKGMMDYSVAESDQWIPWEISYSLRTTTKSGLISRMNAILGVVIPDENNSYGWYYKENTGCNSITHHTNQLFEMLKTNMFNRKQAVTRECNNTTIHEGEFSYIKTVRWDAFVKKSDWYIEKAIEIRDNAGEYNLKINLD